MEKTWTQWSPLVIPELVGVKISLSLIDQSNWGAPTSVGDVIANKQTKEKCQKVIEEDPQCQLLLFIYIHASEYIHDHVYIWQTCQYVYTQTDLGGERVKEMNLKTIHTWINSFIICFKMNSWQENYFLVLQKMTFYLVSFCFLYSRQNTEFFFKAFRKRVALKLGEMVCHCDWLINSDFCWH